MTMPATNFNVPRGSFPTPIKPIGVGPLEGPLVQVAFNYQWCQVIVGSLSQLLLNTTWDVDTQAELTAIQENVFDLMASFCVAPPPAGSQVPAITWDAADMTGIRVDCNCNVFVTCCDGTEIQLATLKQAEGAGVQPGEGSPQPQPGGGCQTYHVVLNANDRWLAPFFVNSGDTITVTNAKGGWWDGTVSPWHCPDGSTFIFGTCTGPGGASGSDPDPSVNHMSLIGSLSGGLYFPVLGGPVTLPGGVVANELWFQANDSILTDNQGSIEFDVMVCNEQAAGWSHTFDLTVSPGPFVARTGSGTPAVWVAGVGWTSAGGGGGTNCYIEAPMMAAGNLTALSAFALSSVPSSGSENAGAGFNLTYFVTNPALADTPGGTMAFAGSQAYTSGQNLNVDMENSNASAAQDLIWTKVIVSGTGPDPF